MLIQRGSDRLTITRYADDILLYAKSLVELEEMTEPLIKELKKAVEEKDRELEVAKEEKHQLVLRCWLNSFLYGGCGNQCRIVRSVFLTFEKSRMAREA